jgi:hypothetical protein
MHLPNERYGERTPERRRTRRGEPQARLVFQPTQTTRIRLVSESENILPFRNIMRTVASALFSFDHEKHDQRCVSDPKLS